MKTKLEIVISIGNLPILYYCFRTVRLSICSSVRLLLLFIWNVSGG